MERGSVVDGSQAADPRAAERVERKRRMDRERVHRKRRERGVPVRRIGRDPDKAAAVQARAQAKRRAAYVPHPRVVASREERLALRREREGPTNAQRLSERRRTNPEVERAKEREARRRWRMENPEKARAKGRRDAQRRRARLLGTDVRTLTQHDLERQAHRQGDACFWCAQRETLTIDHLIPLARGGRHAIGNVVLACSFCNKSRGALLVVEWRTRRATKRKVA